MMSWHTHKQKRQKFCPSDGAVVMICKHVYDTPELVGKPARDGIAHPHLMAVQMTAEHHVPPLRFSRLEDGPESATVSEGHADWSLLCPQCVGLPTGETLTFETFWDKALDRLRFRDFVDQGLFA